MAIILPTIAILLSLGDASSVYQKASGAVVKVSAGGKAGTAFAIDGGRLFVTNQHVVGGSPTVRIEGSPASWGTVVAKDVSRDIALIKPSKAHPISLALELQPPRPGEKIYVIGFPLGFLAKSISEGIVSGVRGQGSDAYIQMTAAISPGSSGSPVLNAQGQAIGVATFSLVDGDGLNFGITSRAVDELKKTYLKKRIASESVAKSEANLSDDGATLLHRFVIQNADVLSAASSKGKRIGSVRKDSLVMVKRVLRNSWAEVSADGKNFGFLRTQYLERRKGVEITLAKGGWVKRFSLNPEDSARIKRLLNDLDDAAKSATAIKKLRDTPAVALYTIYELYSKSRTETYLPDLSVPLVVFGGRVKPFLQWMLADEDSFALENALDGLELISRIEASDNQEGKVKIAKLLGYSDFGYLFDPSLIKRLGELMYSTRSSVKSGALRVLGNISAESLKVELQYLSMKISNEFGPSAFKAYARSANSWVGIVSTLEQIASKIRAGYSDSNEEIDSLDEQKSMIRDYVAVLAKIDLNFVEVALDKLMDKSDNFLVLGALEAMELKREKRFFERVRGIQGRDDAEVRMYALEVLLKLDPRRATTFIIEMSLSSDERNRSYAAYISDRMAKSEGHAIRMRLLKDRSNAVRYMALLAVDLESHEEEFLVKLLTEDPDPDVRKKAFQLLEGK